MKKYITGLLLTLVSTVGWCAPSYSHLKFTVSLLQLFNSGLPSNPDSM